MNNFSVTSKDVGEGLKRSASALATAGNTIDESIALLVAGNNVVQDIDVVATALKTSALRLTTTKGQLEELGEDAEGAAESVTQLQTQLLNLTKGKVDIMLDENTFKSTYQIMLETSKIWDSMSQKNQMSVLELMFGKRGANVGASVLTNMTDAQKVLEDSSNSSGSAMKELDTVLEGIQGRLNKFQTAYESLSKTLVNSGLLKGIISTGTGVMDILNAFFSLFQTGAGEVIRDLALISVSLMGLKKLNSVLDFSKIFDVGGVKLIAPVCPPCSVGNNKRVYGEYGSINEAA